jgi:prepilin-type N-terminal cleavage/methylation domain-containing protein
MTIRTLKGFTLIELIIVIAVIGILMAILVPNLAAYVTESRTTAANANAATVYKSASNIQAKAKLAGKAQYGGFVDSGWGMNDLVYKIGDSAAGGRYPTPDNLKDNVDAVNNMDSHAKWFRYEMDRELSGLAKGSWYAVKIDPNGAVLKAAWSKSDTDTVVGSHPEARTVQDNQKKGNNINALRRSW